MAGHQLARRFKSHPEEFCGAEKRNGKPCLREAGWGTDHRGSGNCKHHGGATDSGKVSAAKDEAGRMAQPIHTTPGQAILTVMALANGQLQYVTEQVAELEGGDVFEELKNSDGDVISIGINRWIRLQRQLQNDVAKHAAAAAGMQIGERQQSLREVQTMMFGAMLEAVLGELKLTPAQKKRVGPAIRAALPAAIESLAS